MEHNKANHKTENNNVEDTKDFKTFQSNKNDRKSMLNQAVPYSYS